MTPRDHTMGPGVCHGGGRMLAIIPTNHIFGIVPGTATWWPMAMTLGLSAPRIGDMIMDGLARVRTGMMTLPLQRPMMLPMIALIPVLALIAIPMQRCPAGSQYSPCRDPQH